MHARANRSRQAQASGTDLAQAMTLGPGTRRRLSGPGNPGTRAVVRPIAPPPVPPPYRTWNGRTWNGRRAVGARIATTPDHTPIRPTLDHRRRGPLFPRTCARRGGLDARGHGLGLGESRQIGLRPYDRRYLQIPRLIQQPSGRLQGVNEPEEVLALGRVESVRRDLGAQDIVPCLGPRAAAGPAMHPAAAVPRTNRGTGRR